MASPTTASLVCRQRSIPPTSRPASPASLGAAASSSSSYCASDARVAFGGVKKSGFGRELSHFGLHEFCNAQTVWKDRR
ncbi:aldehyde dehydrogenase family protein [Klebsiella variicola subsp. variicola]|nr:aldehyde dehydrogenase family protein [Klebsiella variicola subsp. variicola]